MKHSSVVPVSIILSLTVFFLGCTKIDTSTLGAELIPPVDNIHTFEISLDVESDNILFNDSTRALSSDDLPVGYINDPEFGQTKADLYFDVAIPNNKTYPFGKTDSLVCDSVVLSMTYKSAYGDTNSSQTVRVFEIAQGSGFSNDSTYRLDHADFPTTGPQLGSRTFTPTQLNDSVTVVQTGDTVKLVDVIRIPLANSFGTRLMGYDTSYNSTTGGYYSDSLFKTLFRGFAIKTDLVGSALSYFNVGDVNTSLIVYYHHGHTDTASVEFTHAQSGLSDILGVASIVKRTPGAGWDSYLTNGNPSDDLLYVPSTPGSYGLLTIKGLDTMANKVIHLAEVIIPKAPSIAEDKFTPPAQIFLDMINNTNDSVFNIQNDFTFSNFGYNFDQFGGFLRTYAGNPEYRFNVSRHVQGIVTRHEPNFKLRVYAPFETNVWYLPPETLNIRKPTSKLNIPIVNRIAAGRVVLGGGANANPALKLRLRIVYSII